MKRLVSLTVISGLSMFVASHALADGYNSGVVTKAPSPEYTDVEFGSGWYLRGDITYNFGGNSNTSFRAIETNVGSFEVDADYDDSVGVRVGFGQYLTPNFRLEASVEQVFNSDFSGIRGQDFAGSREIDLGGTTPEIVTFTSNGTVTNSTTGAYAIGSNVATIDGTEELEANYRASNFIVNAYYDLPAIGSIKPYVGAGAGLGRVTYNQSRTLTCVAETEEACAFPAGARGAETEVTLTLNEEYWAPTYQLSAGAGVQLDDQWTADLGYSFTSFGDGGEVSYDDGTAFDLNGFDIHQVRVGLRYDIW